MGTNHFERAGCERDGFAVVGDSLESDIGAANAAGVIGIWVNREETVRADGDPLPDYEVKSLTDLQRILGDANGRSG